MSQVDIYQAISRALADGRDAALVTIVATNGSTPQRVGAKMLVFADGETIGTIGGGCYESDAFWKAKEVLETRKPRVVRYELADDIAEESGLICGGQMDVFIEPIEAPPSLVIAGAGHVAQPLARFAHAVGFRVTVIDDRAKFANTERFPTAEAIHVAPIGDWLGATTFSPSTYIVVVTRGHKYDLDALGAVVERPLRYVGLIGSKAKTKRIFDALLARGVAPDSLRRVHAPIGLDLGAVTPEEIAISIVAELIAVKYGKITEPHAVPVSMRWNRV